MTFSCHLIALQVLVVGGDLIDHSAVRQQLDDTVGGSLYNLVVTGGEQQHARELDETVVQGCLKKTKCPNRRNVIANPMSLS